MVALDFVDARIADHSAIEAIFALVEKYQAVGKKVTLKHLSEDCKVLLYKASPIFEGVIEEGIDDPRYHLAANPEDFPKPLGEYKF
jgi:SulP family sulfate permease